MHYLIARLWIETFYDVWAIKKTPKVYDSIDPNKFSCNSVSKIYTRMFTTDDPIFPERYNTFSFQNIKFMKSFITCERF